jgi:hypothetical protein
MFTRTVGSAVGVAIFGSIANTTLADAFRNPPAALAGKLPHSVNSATLAFAGGRRDTAVAAYTRHALFVATHRIFWGLVVAAVLGLLTQLLLPRKTEPLSFDGEQQPAPATAGASA